MDYLEHDGAAGGVAATLAATEAPRLPRIEIVEERRRSHDAAFRARVVADALVPGARIEELGRRYGICTSLIYRWRRAAQGPAASAPAVKLVPVRVAEPSRPSLRSPTTPARPAEGKRPGPIEIELEGGIWIRVDTDVSLAALRRVGGGAAGMIAPPAGVRIWLAAGITDMRRYAECPIVGRVPGGCAGAVAKSTAEATAKVLA